MKKGEKMSQAMKDKISNRKREHPNRYWLNKKRDNVTIEKIRKTLTGKKLDGLKRRGLGKTRQSQEYRNWQKNLWSKRKREADGTHTFGQWEDLKAKYNWTCPACLKKEPDIKLTEDHIIPLSKGGSDNIENIQPLCKSCNCKKLTRTIKF